MSEPSPPSVGVPKFDGTTGVAVAEPAPQPTSRRMPLLPAMGVLVATVVAVLWSLSGDEMPRDEDSESATADAILEPAPVDPVQNDLIDLDRYRTRPTPLVPVRVAVETDDGYLGLGRWNGRWYVSSSIDGIDWTIDLESPLVGVPEAFRPGRLEGQHHISLQIQDGSYWGRFVSRRTAGAAGAVLTLTSEDGQNWAQRVETAPVLDRFEFGGVGFGPSSEWVQRWLGGSWFQQSFDGGETYTTIPWLSVPGPWEPLEIAWSSSGVAVLYYNDEFQNYRLALTTDGRDWETVALQESGRSAVHLIVVGRDDVLLSAADPGASSIELVVPLPRR